MHIVWPLERIAKGGLVVIVTIAVIVVRDTSLCLVAAAEPLQLRSVAGARLLEDAAIGWCPSARDADCAIGTGLSPQVHGSNPSLCSVAGATPESGPGRPKMVATAYDRKTVHNIANV